MAQCVFRAEDGRLVTGGMSVTARPIISPFPAGGALRIIYGAQTAYERPTS